MSCRNTQNLILQPPLIQGMGIIDATLNTMAGTCILIVQETTPEHFQPNLNMAVAGHPWYFVLSAAGVPCSCYSLSLNGRCASFWLWGCLKPGPSLPMNPTNSHQFHQSVHHYTTNTSTCILQPFCFPLPFPSRGVGLEVISIVIQYHIAQ